MLYVNEQICLKLSFHLEICLKRLTKKLVLLHAYLNQEIKNGK